MNILSDILRANGDLLCVAGAMLLIALLQWAADAARRLTKSEPITQDDGN